MRAASKTAGGKNLMARPPLRALPGPRYSSPGKGRGNRSSKKHILRLIVPLAVIATVFLTRPKFSSYTPDSEGFIFREDIGGSDHHIDTKRSPGIQKEIKELPSIEDALKLLSSCDDFDCISEAHEAIGGRTRFNFPHFFLIGWQKCATTSVNLHLRSHPEYLPSPVKESHYFTTCQNFWNHPSCMAHNTSHYIEEFFRRNDAVASNLEKVSLDASVDYAWKGGAIAPQLHKLFPWIKLVIIMREPLSRLVSYIRMYTQKGHAVKGCFEDRSMFDCLEYHLDPNEANSNYSAPLDEWFDYFPAEQFHIIQFEELQADPNTVVRRLKEFLGMDPDLPKGKELKNTNLRKSGGYNMTRGEYENLLDQVRWDSEKVADMLATRGLADKSAWLSRWQQVWDDNLATCDENGHCLINSN